MNYAKNFDVKMSNNRKDLKIIKEAEINMSLNSVSSINKKRVSHDNHFQLRLMNNISRAKVLNLDNQNMCGIHHKVIQNTAKQQDTKNKKRNKNLKIGINSKNNKKNVETGQKCRKSQQSSIQKHEIIDRYHSHRSSYILKNSSLSSKVQRINSQDKQNIDSNIQYDQSFLNKKWIKQDSNNQKKSSHKYNKNKCDFGKLTYIFEKAQKVKGNLNKKKLLLTPPETIFMKDLKTKQKSLNIDQVLYDMRKSQNMIRNSTKYKKDSKISIKSSRNHSFQNRKQRLNSIKIKNSSENCNNIKLQLPTTHKQNTLMNMKVDKARQQNVNKNYLKLKSSKTDSSMMKTCQINQKIVKEDKKQIPIKYVQCRSQYSIKSLLNELNHAGNKNQSQIRKQIDSLTINKEIRQLQSQGMVSQNLSLKNCQYSRASQFLIHNFNQKIYDFSQNQTRCSQSINYNKQLKQVYRQQLINKQSKSIPNYNKNQVEQMIRVYQSKILGLYEELIQEKEKRYQLQQIIETYIFQKQRQQNCKQISKINDNSYEFLD